MARRDSYRWRNWRVDQTSGKTIRLDDQTPPGGPKKSRAGNRSGSDWWWTLLGQETDCGNCGKHLEPPQKIAFRYGAWEIYCPECAVELCVDSLCKPSRKLLRAGMS